jgi:hypothetical protein
MGPDNFTRQPNGQPQRPRPMNNMAQRRPMQPMQDFGPRRQQPLRPMQPMNPQPSQNMQPQPSYGPMPQQRPLNPAPQPHPNQLPQPQLQPFRPQQPLQSQPYQQEAPVSTDFSPQNSQYKKAEKKFRILRPSKLSFVMGTAFILIVAGLLFTNIGKDTAQPKATAQKAAPAQKPLEQPDFTTYFPNPLPDGLSVAKGSISYYKNSFTFILEQSGKKSFFVYEQPASTDPDFSSLKSRIAAPQNIALSVGQGVEGTLDNGTVTAVKTDKNTIMIIDCSKTVCSTLPREILSNMQVNSDLDSLRKNN